MEEKNENIQEEKKDEKKKKLIIILLLIILLLLIFWLGYRVGKIGFNYRDTSAEAKNDSSDIIKIKESDMEEVKDDQLNIFKNEKFDGKNMIAPHSYGEYQFYISNESGKDVKYNIKFSDDLNKLVNMKYRLKIDNVYIRGNSENFIDINNLDISDIIVLKDSTNIFTLEWYWEDNDEIDTMIGSSKETQYYKLNLKIESSEL